MDAYYSAVSKEERLKREAAEAQRGRLQAAEAKVKHLTSGAAKMQPGRQLVMTASAVQKREWRARTRTKPKNKSKEGGPPLPLPPPPPPPSQVKVQREPNKLDTFFQRRPSASATAAALLTLAAGVRVGGGGEEGGGEEGGGEGGGEGGEGGDTAARAHEKQTVGTQPTVRTASARRARRQWTRDERATVMEVFHRFNPHARESASAHAELKSVKQWLHTQPGLKGTFGPSPQSPHGISKATISLIVRQWRKGPKADGRGRPDAVPAACVAACILAMQKVVESRAVPTTAALLAPVAIAVIVSMGFASRMAKKEESKKGRFRAGVDWVRSIMHDQGWRGPRVESAPF